MPGVNGLGALLRADPHRMAVRTRLQTKASRAPATTRRKRRATVNEYNSPRNSEIIRVACSERTPAAGLLDSDQAGAYLDHIAMTQSGNPGEV